MALNLEMALTAGIGSDHVDLDAAMKNKVDGWRLHSATRSRSRTCCHADYLSSAQLYSSYKAIVDGGWNTADCVSRSYDVGLSIGTIARAIGLAVPRRMHPFDVDLHYTDRHRLPEDVEKELNLTFHETAADMVKVCDVVTINCPLHSETEHMFDDAFISTMKPDHTS